MDLTTEILTQNLQYIKILYNRKDSSPNVALTPELADPEIFSSVEQVEVGLQTCMFWSHLLSERQRPSFPNLFYTRLTISNNGNNLMRKY